MLVLQLEATAVDAVMGALNLHAAICQQTVSQISQQVSNQLKPPPEAPAEATTAETPSAGDASPSSDG